ncbi:hypothetical protein [Streptomyces coryli]|uniref:hypothetical protein n=1 Tax=Streptomyces coryli TaxID=1128680 RepID=UPI0023F051B3|nr:hypothetical protein [Streptomyces coryli]
MWRGLGGTPAARSCGGGKLRAAGADEFVLGFLDTDGRADMAAVGRSDRAPRTY